MTALTLVLFLAGPGTVLEIEDGYHPCQKNSLQASGLPRWVSLPKLVVVVGTYEGLLVCADNPKRPDEFYLLRRVGDEHRVLKVVNLRLGRLESFVPSIERRYEP